jgi:cell wall assembly regulator SMI1
MIDLWDRLESFLRASHPALLATLNPPATDAEIARAEAALGVRLPADLAASLKVHNGQIQETGSGEGQPLVPAEYDRNGQYIASWGELAPLDLIVSSTQIGRETLAYGIGDGDGDDDMDADEAFEIRGPVRTDGKWNFVSFVDAGTGDTLAVDLAPAAGGADGQVVSVIHDAPTLIVLAASYREWFERLVERYEAGRYYFGDQDGAVTALDRWNPEL